MGWDSQAWHLQGRRGFHTGSSSTHCILALMVLVEDPEDPHHGGSSPRQSHSLLLLGGNLTCHTIFRTEGKKLAASDSKGGPRVSLEIKAYQSQTLGHWHRLPEHGFGHADTSCGEALTRMRPGRSCERLQPCRNWRSKRSTLKTSV